MRKMIVLSLLAVMSVSLVGCKASSINRIVNTIGEEAGVDVNLDIKQEDLDKIKDKLEEGKDAAEHVLKDEDVQQAVKDLVNATKDSVTEIMETETTTESEGVE